MKLMLDYLSRYHGYEPSSVPKVMGILLKLRKMNHNIWHRKELQVVFITFKQFHIFLVGIQKS